MGQLSPRQLKILKAIVDEYVISGTPVGSELLEKKYKLGISPATVRNEMVRLVDMGYLKQPHTSAGRIPTTNAFRLYIGELMREKEMSVKDEVQIKQELWDIRRNFEQLARNSAYILAQRTKLLAVALTENGNIYYSGAAYILDIPEFYDIDVTKAVLALMDQQTVLRQVLEKMIWSSGVSVLIGEELNVNYLEPCGFVFSRFETAYTSGAIGVIGPTRINYPYVMPVVRYFGGFISQAGK
jgi:heat-inducible transcriptional repressor